MRGDQGSNGTSGNRIQFRFREKIELEVFSQRGGAVHSRLQGEGGLSEKRGEIQQRIPSQVLFQLMFPVILPGSMF